MRRSNQNQRTSRVSKHIEPGFAYRFRLGLQGGNLHDTLSVYLVNIVIFILFYIATSPLVRNADLYYELFPVLILTLIGIEYIVTTYFIEQKSSKVSEPNSKLRSHVRNNKTLSDLNGTKILPCNAKILFLAFITMIIFGGSYLIIVQKFNLRIMKSFNVVEAAHSDDGAFEVSLDVSDIGTDIKSERIIAIINSSTESLYYSSPVEFSDNNLKLSITSRTFLDPEDTLTIRYYVNPSKDLVPKKWYKNPPKFEADDIITRYVSIKNGKIKTTYPFLP